MVCSSRSELMHQVPHLVVVEGHIVLLVYMHGPSRRQICGVAHLLTQRHQLRSLLLHPALDAPLMLACCCKLGLQVYTHLASAQLLPCCHQGCTLFCFLWLRRLCLSLAGSCLLLINLLCQTQRMLPSLLLLCIDSSNVTRILARHELPWLWSSWLAPERHEERKSC